MTWRGESLCRLHTLFNLNTVYLCLENALCFRTVQWNVFVLLSCCRTDPFCDLMYSKKLSMDFIEGSRGIYRPIGVCESVVFTGVLRDVNMITWTDNKLVNNIILLPSQVLFDTPIYEQALQICWQIGSCKYQVRPTIVFTSSRKILIRCVLNFNIKPCDLLYLLFRSHCWLNFWGFSRKNSSHVRWPLKIWMSC